MEKLRTTIAVVVVIAVMVALGYWAWRFCVVIWAAWRKLESDVAVGLVAAAATVMAATLSVMLGRYWERRRDIEAHFRERKIAIYDEFLLEFFSLLQSSDSKLSETNATVFLQEWHRKIILWGGPGVLRSYIEWNSYLKAGRVDAAMMARFDTFLKELRKDLGQSNKNLGPHTFVHFILRNPGLFIEAAKRNPNLTLDELSKLEREAGLGPES